mmetsp:Transcript_40424/g.46342  ORF Transcript_40424/g.46342 Transcript_40424/m.46342 type:complete len:99 (-) Transcript_40424:64-360(-)
MHQTRRRGRNYVSKNCFQNSVFNICPQAKKNYARRREVEELMGDEIPARNSMSKKKDGGKTTISLIFNYGVFFLFSVPHSKNSLFDFSVLVLLSPLFA